MRCHPQRESLCDYSLAISQFAIENGPSIVDLPIKNDGVFSRSYVSLPEGSG